MMPPQSKKPGVFGRLAAVFKGHSSKSAVEHPQVVAEIANASSGPLPPHDSSTPSTIPLPLGNDLTTLNVQGSVSQTSMQPSTNEHQQIESMRPTASAPCLAASASTTPIHQEPVPRPLNATAGGPPSYTPQTPSLASPPPISFFDGAHDFQMRDVHFNVMNATTVRETSENGVCLIFISSTI